jgi:peroxiredoxin
MTYLGAVPPAETAGRAYKRIWDEHRASRIARDELSARLLAHALRWPYDPTAIQALTFVADTTWGMSEPHLRAMEALLKDYALGPHAELLLAYAGSSRSGMAFLNEVGARHPEKRVRALAYRRIIHERTFYLKFHYQYLTSRDRSKTLPPEILARMMGEVARWEKDIAEARRRMNAPDLTGAIFSLAIGSPCPDTPTVDKEGRKVSLADLRGKVVVLDFWFIACGPCRKAVPSANALIKEMKGRPFAQVGVNTDSPDTLKEYLAKADMPWIHWRIEEGTRLHSRFLTDWDVEAYPTIYVIDHEGVIRHRQVGYDPKDDRITPLVRDLVKKAEAARGKP